MVSLSPSISGKRVYKLVREGEAMASVAERAGVSVKTAERRAVAWSRKVGAPWPPPAPVGELCYRAYVILRDWERVTLLHIPDHVRRCRARLAESAAKRWATTHAMRWPTGRD